MGTPRPLLVAIPVLAAVLAGCTVPEEETTPVAEVPAPSPQPGCMPRHDQHEEYNMRFQYSYEVPALEAYGAGMEYHDFNWTDDISRLVGVRLNITWDDEKPLSADFMRVGVWHVEPGSGVGPYRGYFVGANPMVVEYEVDERVADPEGMRVTLAPAGDPSLPAQVGIVLRDHPVNVTVTQIYRC